VLLNPRIDPVKIVLFGGFWIPTQSKADQNALSTYRADWDFGISGNYGIATFQASYLNTADYGEEFDVANEFRWGLGFNIPIIPKVLRGIAEINRIHYDGGTTKPGDFSEVLAGARFAVGETGLTASGALRVNIDRWVKYGLHPSPIGGLVQLAYSPVLPSTLVVSAPAAATAPEPAPLATTTTNETTASTSTPAPASATEPPPAARPETTTTDEILFDSAKSRLTNIAKAILDGVALRLKNNLAATCTIVAFTDPKEKGGDHMGLARARAEAAKDYLIKRHGIDGARIRLDSKGDTEAGPEALRNRRAVVTVTFP
jgi:outer membrane protein OmpA-like peptidoglycan-associated protein